MILPRNLADWPDEWKFLWSERAAILTYLANFPVGQAEIEAEKDIRKQAINYQFPKSAK